VATRFEYTHVFATDYRFSHSIALGCERKWHIDRSCMHQKRARIHFTFLARILKSQSFTLTVETHPSYWRTRAKSLTEHLVDANPSTIARPYSNNQYSSLCSLECSTEESDLPKHRKVLTNMNLKDAVNWSGFQHLDLHNLSPDLP